MLLFDTVLFVWFKWFCSIRFFCSVFKLFSVFSVLILEMFSRYVDLVIHQPPSSQLTSYRRQRHLCHSIGSKRPNMIIDTEDYLEPISPYRLSRRRDTQHKCTQQSPAYSIQCNANDSSCKYYMLCVGMWHITPIGPLDVLHVLAVLVGSTCAGGGGPLIWWMFLCHWGEAHVSICSTSLVSFILYLLIQNTVHMYKSDNHQMNQ